MCVCLNGCPFVPRVSWSGFPICFRTVPNFKEGLKIIVSFTFFKFVKKLSNYWNCLFCFLHRVLIVAFLMKPKKRGNCYHALLGKPREKFICDFNKKIIVLNLMLRCYKSNNTKATVRILILAVILTIEWNKVWREHALDLGTED